MTHIEQRHDTAAIWASDNPVLYEGEVGWEKDTRRSKLGDGVTAWNDLLYSVSTLVVTKADVGLGSADNTSDMDKPVSTATAAAIAGKANIASPTFTGDPKVPTAAPGDNDTSIASTAFVQAAITAAVSALILAAHPVGSLEFNVTGTNPGTYLGGTWVAWGTGQVPVGVDIGQTEFATVELTGGEKTHTLIAGEIPAHIHALGGSTGNESVNHTHTVPHSVRYVDNTPIGGLSRRIVAVDEHPAATANILSSYNTTSNGASVDHTHTLPANTGNNSGGGGAHNNLQPFITCYMFKRTA